MSQPRVDVISIGTLSRNLLWKEAEAKRTPHSTCVLIRADGQTILVDPSLPEVVLIARLAERTGLSPDAITTVFCTNARPAHRSGIAGFPRARRLMSPDELSLTTEHLQQLLQSAEESSTRKLLQNELATLGTFAPADDKLCATVDLFPLPGFTPGNCGLLIAAMTQTIIIAGDAVATQDHLLAGQVLPHCVDLDRAKESLMEVYEIADIIIPGHDNLFINPRR